MISSNLQPSSMVVCHSRFVLSVALTAYGFMPRDLHDLWRNRIVAVAAFLSWLVVAAMRLANVSSSWLLPVVDVGKAVYRTASTAFGRKFLAQQFGDAQ
jgi:hypothetical protein